MEDEEAWDEGSVRIEVREDPRPNSKGNSPPEWKSWLPTGFAEEEGSQPWHAAYCF